MTTGPNEEQIPYTQTWELVLHLNATEAVAVHESGMYADNPIVMGILGAVAVKALDALHTIQSDSDFELRSRLRSLAGAAASELKRTQRFPEISTIAKQQEYST